MNILEIEGLSKRFADVVALDDVNFHVEKGSICGILGPNGAGKTTMLRIINSILSKDSGSVRINGREVSLETSRLLGYMPEERGLYDKMSVEDQIMFFGELKGGSKKRLREVMKEYLAIFNLEGSEKRKIKELSKGNQQKVQIISTLVHEPELVILDEPFSGFDPINGALLQELIARLHERETTIMLSSHNMPAIEEMCNDIALINKGKVLLRGTLENIKEANMTNAVIFTTSSPISESLLMDSGLLENIEPTKGIRGRKGYSYKAFKKPGVKNHDILSAIFIQGDVLHFENALPSLNEIFIKYTSSTNQEINN